MRRAEIANVSFLRGSEEDMFCVYLYEDDVKRDNPLKSIHYAYDVVENWENGIIKIQVLDEDDGYHD